MQNSVIDLLISDDLHENMKYSAEYKRFSDESFEIYKKLSKQLKAEQLAAFEKFADLSMGVECEANEAYFKAGLKMGLRIAVECLAET